MSYKLRKLRDQKAHLLLSGMVMDMETYRATVAEIKMIDHFEELINEVSEVDEDDDV